MLLASLPSCDDLKCRIAYHAGRSAPRATAPTAACALLSRTRPATGGRRRQRVSASVDAAPALPSLAETPSKALTAGITPLLSCEPGVYAVYDAAGVLQYVGACAGGLAQPAPACPVPR